MEKLFYLIVAFHPQLSRWRRQNDPLAVQAQLKSCRDRRDFFNWLVQLNLTITWSELQRELDSFAQWQERGYVFLVPGENEFPKYWLKLEQPVWALSVLGDLRQFERKQRLGITVVGAREITSLSQQWLQQEFRKFLEQNPQTVVISGGARGVDQTAHRLALLSGHSTWVYLPSGLHQIYPAELRGWQFEVLERGGGFISEFHPETSMQKSHFLQRNRLLACAGQLTLIVQARIRSGTWVTARHAIDMQWGLAVVPAHPQDRSQFSGNLKLMSEGASLALDAIDLNLLWRQRAAGTLDLVGETQ